MVRALSLDKARGSSSRFGANILDERWSCRVLYLLYDAACVVSQHSTAGQSRAQHSIPEGARVCRAGFHSLVQGRASGQEPVLAMGADSPQDR